MRSVGNEYEWSFVNLPKMYAFFPLFQDTLR